MNLKMREWGDALIMVQLFAAAGSWRNGTLAAHRGDIPFYVSFFSFGIIGIILVILSFHVPDKSSREDQKKSGKKKK